MTRRSTETITVLSPLSLTTVPCRIRFGIAAISSTLRRRRGSQHRLDPRDVAPHLAHARRALELPGRLLEAQVELFLLQLQKLILQLVRGLGPQIGRLHHAASSTCCTRRTNRVSTGS